jgi:hypothetical protein
MELAVRDIRHAKNPLELENGLGGLSAAYTTVTRELDSDRQRREARRQGAPAEDQIPCCRIP